MVKLGVWFTGRRGKGNTKSLIIGQTPTPTPTTCWNRNHLKLSPTPKTTKNPCIKVGAFPPPCALLSVSVTAILQRNRTPTPFIIIIFLKQLVPLSFLWIYNFLTLISCRRHAPVWVSEQNYKIYIKFNCLMWRWNHYHHLQRSHLISSLVFPPQSHLFPCKTLN